MDTTHTPAISKLVAAQGGPVALSQKLGGTPAYQEIQRWLKRGWASPMHIFRLAPFLPEGVALADLDQDRAVAGRSRTAQAA